MFGYDVVPSLTRALTYSQYMPSSKPIRIYAGVGWSAAIECNGPLLENVRGGRRKNIPMARISARITMSILRGRDPWAGITDFYGSRKVCKLKRRSEGSAAAAFFQSRIIPRINVVHGQSDQGVQTVFSLFVETAMNHGSPPAVTL